MSERFPRAKLFARIADLQEEVGSWNAISLRKYEQAVDHGYSAQVQKAFADRATALEEIRQLLDEARRTMYYCR